MRDGPANSLLTPFPLDAPILSCPLVSTSHQDTNDLFVSCSPQVLLNESGEVDPNKFVGKVTETVNNVRAEQS